MDISATDYLNKNGEIQNEQKCFRKNSHQKNDIYLLIINCEDIQLSIENERTGEHHDM